MMEEIFKDAVYFGIIFVYILLAYSTFFHFARDTGNENFFDTFSKVYLMGFGEFDFHQDNPIE